MTDPTSASIRSRIQYAVIALGVGLVTLAGGCSTVGWNLPRDDGPSTATYRYEAELIPNAEFMRDNTSPDWQLGRYTFKRGADRLLVISRITTLDQQLPEGEKRKRNTPTERIDAVIERVWITLPLGTPIGQVLMLEELEDEFLIGYDEWDIDSGNYYIQPNKIYGKLTIIEDGTDEMIISANMRVEPDRLPRWNFRRDNLNVPVAISGIRAEPTSEDIGGDEPEGPGIVGDPLLEGPTNRPAVVVPGLITPAGQATDPGTLLAGQWLGINDDREIRIQFDPDGQRFVFSSTREGGHDPGMRYGTYRIKATYLILDLNRFVYGNVDHMPFLLPPHDPEGTRFMVLRFHTDGEKLALEGDFRDPIGHKRLRLTRDEYEDMNETPPPARP